METYNPEVKRHFTQALIIIQQQIKTAQEKLMIQAMAKLNEISWCNSDLVMLILGTYLPLNKRSIELNWNHYLVTLNKEQKDAVECSLSEKIWFMWSLPDMSIKDIAPENIYNYDETNVTDDPGKKKVIAKRGVKYVDYVQNASKAAISLMFCGSASGTMLPPYVVYRSTHLWATWCSGGPPGSRYNQTKNGWFDALVFQDWFESLFLPHVRRLQVHSAHSGEGR
uniref:DDE-1 domain-containing protein n=1 Tax=Romanomermis culicivorax TaxID=13658 RepID=A0A915I3W4_ROMCU